MNTLGNPLLQTWPQAHGLPDFGAIAPEHFPPAFEAALAGHRAEIDAIARQAGAPSFANTVAAFDASGRLLARLEHLFYTLAASATSPALQAVQRALAAPLAEHGSAVYMHQGLFARIDALFERRESLGLTPEQRRLLERLHLDFVRAGARLAPAARERCAAVMARLAELNTRFAQNVLGAESGYQLKLTTTEELAGLPDFVRAAARQDALDRGLAHEGVHVITLSRSLILPFLSFSARRDLREQAWRAWVGRGDDTGDTDNRAICREILELRAEQARLHGHPCYADYALEDTMARSQAAVMGLLERVWHPALAALQCEREAVLGAMAAAGASHALEPWDWRFYAEQARRARFELDEAEVKPYFPLHRMVAAMFDCAGRLFGLQFKARPDIRGYHADVRAWEVFDADGRLSGLFLQDNFARPAKRSGAWMNALRNQSRALGATPVILNNNNFARGGGSGEGEPTLLSFDDVRTLFHEFGHGLHGLLSNVEHERLAGTQVLRDFVELPSQLFEHWMAEPEVLKKFARHWRTGEPLPDALLARLQAARQFGQGYETLRYTASAIVDMAAHALPAAPADVVAFEAATVAAWGLPAEVGMNHRLTHFQHLFSSAGYAAGY